MLASTRCRPPPGLAQPLSRGDRRAVVRLALAAAPRRALARAARAVLVPLTDDERAGCETPELFRLGIRPYYLSLIDREHPLLPGADAVDPRARRGAHPRPGELRDPLGEDKTGPVPAIVHKYPDRVLFLALDALLRLLPALHPPPHHQGREAELAKGAAAGHRVHPRAPRGARRAHLGRRPVPALDERLEELLRAAARDSPRGDDPHRHPRARCACRCG